MIIGITGTNGAGKGTVVDYLVKEKGFAHYSVTELLLEEIDKRGLPRNRDSMRTVANDLRKQHGPAAAVEALHTKAKESGGDVLIDALRVIGEAEFLKSHGAKVLAVDADRKLRYERIALRGGEKDNVSYEQFCAQEDLELNSKEIWDMNILGVIALADAVVMNDGTKDELYAQAEEALKKLGHNK